MADRPISFSAPMVLAVLAGRKTQERRLLRCEVPSAPTMSNVHELRTAKHPAPYLDAYCSERATPSNPRGMSRNWCWWTRDDRSGRQFDMGFAPGDRLWVREAWQLHSRASDFCSVVYRASIQRSWTEAHEMFPDAFAKGRRAKPFQTGWCSSTHMPRWASRLTLDVTAVRVERVQDISCADAIAEGVAPAANSQTIDCDTRDPRDGFRDLWDSLHGPDAWAENPWVAVLEFSARHVNIDALDRQPAASALPLSQEAR